MSIMCTSANSTLPPNFSACLPKHLHNTIVFPVPVRIRIVTVSRLHHDTPVGTEFEIRIITMLFVDG